MAHSAEYMDLPKYERKRSFGLEVNGAKRPLGGKVAMLVVGGAAALGGSWREAKGTGEREGCGCIRKEIYSGDHR